MIYILYVYYCSFVLYKNNETSSEPQATSNILSLPTVTVPQKMLKGTVVRRALAHIHGTFQVETCSPHDLCNKPMNFLNGENLGKTHMKQRCRSDMYTHRSRIFAEKGAMLWILHIITVAVSIWLVYLPPVFESSSWLAACKYHISWAMPQKYWKISGSQ